MTRKSHLAITAALIGCLGAGAAQAEPGGCLKYGAAGAVGGHFAHHTVGGAVGGCAVGMVRRHEYRKHQREMTRRQSAEQSAPPPQ